MLFSILLGKQKFCSKIQQGITTTIVINLSAIPLAKLFCENELGYLLFLIYTANMSKTENTKIESFANDVVVLSVDNNPIIASQHLHTYLNLSNDWYTKWRTKIIKNKKVQITGKKFSFLSSLF